MLEVILNIDSKQERKQVPVTNEGLTIGRSSASSIVVADDGGLSVTTPRYAVLVTKCEL